MPYFKWQRAVLWIEVNATFAEVKEAYRKVSRKYHPDLNPWCLESEKMMKKITYAYDILTNPEKQEEHITMMKKKIKEEQSNIAKKNKVLKNRAKNKKK